MNVPSSVMRPTRLLFCSVNQSAPSGPNTMSSGSPGEVGVSNSVSAPVAGSNRPIAFRPGSVK